MSVIRFSLRRSRGQAMPLGIVLIMFGALTTLVLFNTGQLTSEKTRVANAADAAAYSGLVWQARALNYNSYTNRAMVANQVSIAQFVSLNSWTSYSKIKARNINNTVGLIPFIRPFTEAVAQVVNIVDMVVGIIASVAIPIIDTVNVVLSATQEAAYYSAFAATPGLVKEVVEANDENFNVESKFALYSLAANVISWSSFTQSYSDEASLERKADIITRSRDDFTSAREWELGRFNMGLKKYSLKKEGSTHLVKNGDEWAWIGKDTQSLHSWKFVCSWTGCKWKHGELPIGWGSVYTPDNLACGDDCPSWGRMNKTAQEFATAEAESVGGYSGINAYYDLTDLSEENKDPRMLLRIEVASPESGIDTSSRVGLSSPNSPDDKAKTHGFGEGMFFLGDEFASNSIASVASAEIYFERPSHESSFQLRVNGQNQREYGSLWNPYWQVRLAETPKEQTLAAWAVRSPDLIEATATGVVQAGEEFVQEQQDYLAELTELEEYAQETIANLSDYRTQQEQIESSLESAAQEIISQSESLESARDVVSQTESTIATVNQEIDELSDQREQLEARLTADLSSIERATIENDLVELGLEISGLTSQADSLENNLASARSYVETQFNNYQESLANELALQQSYQDISSVIANAEQLRAELTSIDFLNEITENTLENYTDDLVFDQLGDVSEIANIVGNIRNGDAIQEYAQEQFVDYAEERVTEYLEDQVMDQLEEAIKNAATNALQSYAGSYSGYVDYAENVVNNAEAVVNSAEEEYIEPLQETLAEMQEQLQETEREMREQMDEALQVIRDDIDYLQSQMQVEMGEVSDRINNQIATLTEQINVETDPLIQQQLQLELDSLRNSLTQEVGSVEDGYQQRILALQNSLITTSSQFEQNINNEILKIKNEIEELEQKIASIKSVSGNT